ncbi:MAG: S-layer homology domain-containing protein [Armatimonadota bacterium]
MKQTAYILVALLVVIAAPVFGQAFTDVPADHWAYDAINQLQKDGILIGYPDGTFQGKRTITRYEFATAIARLADWVNSQVQPGGPAAGLGKEDVEKMLGEYAKKSELPSVPGNLATKDDIAAIRKLVDEFRDEIAALGVDVDALKRDVAALGARVDAIEAEMKRVRITGEANVFGVALSSTSAAGGGPVVNLDQRSAVRPNEAFMRNIGFVKDFDLKIAGRVSQTVSATAQINYGNYLSYLGSVDDYAPGPLPTTTTDGFFPYYTYIEATMGKGSLTVGRFPLQFTPYTLKKIDVDSYTSIVKTDDGNYPVDGAKIAWNFGGVDVTLFAAKNDQNAMLANGLTAQPTIFAGAASLHQGVAGHAVGGLSKVTQSAGLRANIAIPWEGNLGLTYYQAWDRSGWVSNVTPNLGTWDQARVYGADLTVMLPWVESLAFTGSWTRSDTIKADTAPRRIGDVDYLNTAWDAKFSGNLASLSIAAGYKSIGRNFAAAGAWDKIGRWTNPVGVRGPYAEIAYPVTDNLKISLNGEFLKGGDKDNPYMGAGVWGANPDDKLTVAQAAIKWGFTRCNSLDLAYHWVKFDPNAAALDSATENYFTVGLAHQLSQNAGVRIGYQLISYDNGSTNSGPWVADYRGSQGVVQFGVSF